MKVQLCLSTIKFNILDYRTWLSPFIKLVTYFRNRGLNGSIIKYHHCFIKVENKSIEALAEGIVIRDFYDSVKQYNEILILDLNFEFDEEGFVKWCYSLQGVKYDYVGVMFYKLIFQIFGVWLRNKNSHKRDCTYMAEGFFMFACDDRKEEFKEFAKFDPQDFVRMQSERVFIANEN